MDKVCIIIPAYNESEGIGPLLNKLKSLGLSIVVVDDGSTDDTVDIALKNGAVVLKQGRNCGKGAALKRGFEYILNSDYETAITIDADGQHDPGSIINFINIQKETLADIVIGNRMRNTENMPLSRIVTNRFMSWIISHASKQKIPDTQCGFRLIQRKVLENVVLYTSRYDMESEILIKAAKIGYKIESVPIETIYKGSKSQIHPILDTLRFIRTYLALFFIK
ncbi:MAG: dolichyl-phosphate mannose synthase [Candidatus Omnitrophica bacterium CG11_big_fil_rev_8_21_14_0_20_42_13]|uniref:Dolichyl-phosphate mannose synthase n=1 Tax=Candidatus Ghiorseimicrobium undicola TaxID=1974746 RepID=A0A2H0LZQ7_9BACT|nr:MAG: dolichyl-phosphate mannose synthase [Candidatus Omnitrophica bacterium CG11_big_fil_rev_8_21_14_0_20_42_13]